MVEREIRKYSETLTKLYEAVLFNIQMVDIANGSFDKCRASLFS